mmetsp:Transcript_35149/g.89004  ORF Transcript_35149/g.89004 Transcript_35149/m.89004 type:complete len:268 (-) Transcript_35149:864-1667(-)
MATSSAGLPVMRHVCGPAGCSKGKQRSVACVSSLTRFSSSSLAAHPPRAHLPSAMAALSSSYDLTSTMCASRKARASASSAPCTSSSVLCRCATNADASMGTPICLPSLPGLSRRATTQPPASTSLGPTSTRTGTPFISQWLNFHPGVCRLSASTLTRMPAPLAAASSAATASITAGRSPSFLTMGTMTTCTGAMRGGRRSPLSSPCVMMMPPIMRVDTPHELWCTSCWAPFSSRYCVPNALAKFEPRLCDVPACSARLSPIMASMV